MRNALLGEELIRRGHKVTYFASAFNHYTKKFITNNEEPVVIDENSKVIFLKGIGYKKNISFRRYIEYKILAYRFRRYVTKLEKPDVIVSAIPPYGITYEALIFSIANKIPIIVDTRDKWPDTHLEYFPQLFRGLFRVALWRDFEKIKKISKQATGLTAVSKDMLCWMVDKSKRTKNTREKVFYLGYNKRNTSGQNEFSDKIPRDKFVVTYVGSFGGNTDQSIVLSAAKILKEDFYFIFVGSGGKQSDLKKKFENLNNILFTGWLDQASIDTILDKTSVGVCPTAKGGHLMPNKIFTYFSAGKPILSGYSGELENMITDEKLGLNFKYNDLSDFISKLQMIKGDKKLYEEMSSNVFKIYREKFEAPKIYGEFAEFVENITEL